MINGLWQTLLGTYGVTSIGAAGIVKQNIHRLVHFQLVYDIMIVWLQTTWLNSTD
jgi:hypothetical protein